MRRAVILSLMALLLFALAAWSGFYVASRVAPERLRSETERRLADRLGADVRIDQIRISLRWGLVLEARGVEVLPPRPGSRLFVERASARLDPGALLMARFRLDRLALEGFALHLEPDARGEASVGPPDLQGAIAWLEERARSLLEKPLPIRTLELERGSILFRDARADVPVAIEVTGLRGLARQMSFRRRKELRIQGRIQEQGTARGDIRLRVEADRSLRATLSLAPFDLGVLEPYAARLGIARDLSGTAEGTLRWEVEPGEPQTWNLRLDGSGVRASLLRSAASPPFEIALERSTLAARIESSRDVLRLQEAELSDGRLTLRADGSLALPLGPRAGLRLALQLVELPLSEIEEVLAYLPSELRTRLAPLSERVEAGRLIALRAEAHTTLAGLRELTETRLLGRRGELSIGIDLAGARLRLGERRDRLAELSGRALWTGDGLELRDVRGRIGERVLPTLDVTLQGLAEIRDPDELNCVRPPAVEALPGYPALQRWIRSHRKPGAKRSWTRLSIEAEWLLHPAFLCSVEHALAEFIPGPDGFDVDLPHGVWAGVPIRGTARFRRVPEERLAIDMTVGAPFEPMWIEPPEQAWAKGRWQFDTTRLGGWQMRGASGQFRLIGSALRLEESALHLAPLGDLEGNAIVELGSGDELPYRIEAFVRKMDVEDMLLSAGREEALLSGRLLGAGVIDGHLHEGQSLLADAEGLISLHARGGVVQKELPPFVAIAVVSDRFNPFRGRDEMPYTAIDLVARLEGGRFHSDAFTMHAPSLRVAVTGQAEAVAEHRVEAVMGLFFFRTLDALINRVPVLNRFILGEDENLLGAYFAMTGTWSQPKATLIPVKSFAEGPVHFMLEGPSFVWNGLRRLESLLSGLNDAPAKPAEEEPES